MNTETNWKKNVALFLFGQTFSLFGSMMVQYAIMWHITLKTQSGSMMTLFILAGMLPTFFISPFGGVWADRFNRKYLINTADAIIALASLAVALLFFAGFDALWILFVCSTIRALGSGVQMPAVNALVPQLVPLNHLTRINGINSSIQSAIAIASPIVGALLLTLAPIEYIFFIDVITAAIGISILFFLVKVPQVERSADNENNAKHNYFHDLKQGFSYIAKHKFILHLVILYTFSYFVFTPLSFLTPLQVTRNFGADVWRLSVIEITFSAGMLLGGLLISLWGSFKNKMNPIVFALFINGVGAIALGVTGNFWVYAFIMAGIGIILPFWSTPFTVILQEKVDMEYLGRVFGVLTMAPTLVMPMGMVIFGPLSDVVNIDIMLIVSGFALFVLTIPFLASKVLREAGKSTEKNTADI